MNNLKLTRLNEPNIEKLNKMKSALKEFLNEKADLNNAQWIENLDTILDFQDDDGSFKLLSTYELPTDKMMSFCYEPTYICTSILMKAYIIGDSRLSKKVEGPLINGIEMGCMRIIYEDEYESLQNRIEALKIFMKGGLREFIDLNSEFNPSLFTEMIYHIIAEFERLEREENFKDKWGKDYKEEILEINRYFNIRKVFVYGTLMTGENNHLYLENSKCLGNAAVEGYEMYNVGWFPAIVPGKSTIPGELYEVPKEDMDDIDMLEGEGSLYTRKCKETTDKSLAYIYEYAQDISGLEKIDSWKDYVWYVAYGSNMLYDRFICYIEGGSYDGSRPHPPCNDTTPPVAVKPIEIPYDMYFGNTSEYWDYGGVSFLDTSKEGHALGVAYLITREQFNHVAKRENAGRFPNGTGFWYENIISLGKMDGYEMITVSNKKLRDKNEPCERYLNTLKKGIKENWSEISDEDIDNYLDSCIRRIELFLN